MCSVAVRAGRERGAGRGRQGARASEGAKEELPARHGRGRKQHHVAQESRFCRPLVAGLILCHAKVKRGPYTSSYFYDSGGEKVVGWEGQTKLRY